MKLIKGYSDYAVTKSGKVISLKYGRKKELKSHINSDGYASVSLSNGATKKNCRVNRLILETFIDNPENKPQCNHKNGNKLDNNIKNLEWATRSENMQHAHKTGLKTCVGEKNSQAKLNYGQVVVIKKLLERGNMKVKEIAEFFGVVGATITQIKKVRSWKHI